MLLLSLFHNILSLLLVDQGVVKVPAFQMLHEKLIEEVNHQIYSRSVQAATSHMGRAGRLRRHDSRVRGWKADEILPETPSSSHTGE